MIEDEVDRRPRSLFGLEPSISTTKPSSRQHQMRGNSICEEVLTTNDRLATRKELRRLLHDAATARRVLIRTGVPPHAIVSFITVVRLTRIARGISCR